MESRKKFDESIVQFENGKENSEATNIEKAEKTVVGKPRGWFGRVYWIARTLRLVELLILVALLPLTIYLTATDTRKLLSSAAKAFLIVLFVIYLLILSFNMIGRITERTLPDTLMFLFGVLGFLLFVVAAERVYVRLRDLAELDSVLLAIVILCIIEAILLLLDFTLIILNWRKTYTRVDRCPSGTPASNVTIIYKPECNYSQRTVRPSDPLVFEENVCDVTTSISDYQRPSHPDLVNLHKYRKIGEGHPRHCVDRPVDALSVISLNVAGVQTEPPQQKTVSDVESLIVAEVRDGPAQTSPKCPVCANHWYPQRALYRPDNFGLCPTFLHLAQGFGMCNCSQQSSSVLRPIPVRLATESTSATDLGVSTRT